MSGSGSFIAKAIDITITLGQGTFGQTGFNTVKLSGLRCVAAIAKAGFPSMDRAQIRIYGVQPSIMNQVSTLGIPLTGARVHNSVLIEAGDTTNGMAIVYSGYMQNAWQDFSESPDTSLNIVGFGALPAAMTPVPPISFPGAADVATIMAGLAQQMGFAFENSGVQIKLSNPYFAGTALDQAHAVARAANIEMYVDTGAATASSPGTGTLAIWPKTGTRGGMVPLVSAGTGLVGYPTFQSNGMSFQCLFNPNIRIGGQINFQSTTGAASVPASVPINGGGAGPLYGSANGAWYVVGPLAYDLAAQMPGGPWFCNVSCARLPGPGASS